MHAWLQEAVACSGSSTYTSDDFTARTGGSGLSSRYTSPVCLHSTTVDIVTSLAAEQPRGAACADVHVLTASLPHASHQEASNETEPAGRVLFRARCRFCSAAHPTEVFSKMSPETVFSAVLNDTSIRVMFYSDSSAPHSTAIWASLIRPW